MIRCTPGKCHGLLRMPYPPSADHAHRTASELKVKQAQSDETGGELTAAAFKFAVGFDTTAGTVEESADRALSGVTRKLDKGLSVEFTVNELISEATDPQNLANMFIGARPQPHHIRQRMLMISHRMVSTLLSTSVAYHTTILIPTSHPQASLFHIRSLTFIVACCTLWR